MPNTDTNPVITLNKRTAFVLGNGPSLKGIDLPALTGHMSIGMNAAYRYWDRINWRPTHYTCLDLVVGISHKEEIRRLIREGRDDAFQGPTPIGRFLLRSNLISELGVDAADSRVLNYDAIRMYTPLFQIDPVTTGSHAVLWAHLERADPIIIMGIDGKYREIVDGAKRGKGIELEITENKDNPNYFFSGYQQVGDRYNIPNPRPNLHLSAWEKVAETLSEKNVQIANGNTRSEVAFFPYVDCNQLIEEGSAPLSRPQQSVMSENSSESAQNALSIKIKNAPIRPIFLVTPFLAAVATGLLWLAGASALAIMLLAGMVAATISLLLHLLGTSLPRLRTRQANDVSLELVFSEVSRQLQALERERVNAKEN
ncbi:hypothetical protein [Aestuariicoccus sp. MJ-SS9]|uniref:hypothetical protein n=1 Tax=Aestuariicoccus sp. MJ-SS9 TaxID=3079855 RepID=UPI002910A1F0|nr:hypothetical protein [Aestuariicoccus sp. MJ-SS9]MDU8913287.1 hypothetical protein [Aestuariicoccus sp. MJ-SS9]